MSIEDLTILFDKDGYPCEQSLDDIEQCCLASDYDCSFLLDLIAEVWKWDDWAEKIGNLYEFRTGGWSGNESLIGAVMRNPYLKTFSEDLCVSGGHYLIGIGSKRRILRNAKFDLFNRLVEESKEEQL